MSFNVRLYDFRQFSIWPENVQKGTKIGPSVPNVCIQMPRTSELPGAPSPGPSPGEPHAINAPLASLAIRFNYMSFNG